MAARIRYLLVIASLCIAPFTGNVALAALYQFNLSITGGATGTGTIGLNDTVGSGAADPDLESFSFTVTSDFAGFGTYPFTFTSAMISAIDWSIAPTGALSLDLDVSTQTSGGKLYDISFDTLAPILSSAACGASSVSSPSSGYAYCVASVAGVTALTSGGLTATPATTVPEPATLALLGLGLAGLGFSRRKQ